MLEITKEADVELAKLVREADDGKAVRVYYNNCG